MKDRMKFRELEFEFYKEGDVRIEIEGSEGYDHSSWTSLDDLERVVTAAREYCGHKTLADAVLELRGHLLGDGEYCITRADGEPIGAFTDGLMLDGIIARIDDHLRAMGKLEEIDE